MSAKPQWIPYRRQGKLPPERRYVMVIVPRRPASIGEASATVAVGYLRIHSDGPFWVVPGVEREVPDYEVTHWCDCLGDDFQAPCWPVQQVVGAPRRQWRRD